MSLRQHWPEAEVVLVEPQSELISEMRQRFSGASGITLLEAGAGPRNETKTFFEHERSDSSTFRGRGPRTVDKRDVEVHRIDWISSEAFGQSVPDILKLDCEGWDLEVIQGAGDLLGRIPVIFMEAGVTNPEFENSVCQTVEQMAAAGYGMFDFGEAARNGNGALWNAEICFVLRGSRVWRAATTWCGD